MIIVKSVKDFGLLLCVQNAWIDVFCNLVLSSCACVLYFPGAVKKVFDEKDTSMSQSETSAIVIGVEKNG